MFELFHICLQLLFFYILKACLAICSCFCFIGGASYVPCFNNTIFYEGIYKLENSDRFGDWIHD